MKLENKNNKILDDLNTRNENWEKLDGIPEKVTDLETNQDTIKQETDLKVAKVERELDQFIDTVSNINTNQEATQVAQGYGVVNLPKTAGEGKANFSIKGVTDENGLSTQGATRVKSVSQDLGKESTQYLPNVGELRSLPNGVADEIVNGELVKRVNQKLFEIGDGYTLTNGSNNQWLAIPLSKLAGVIPQTTAINKSVIVSGFVDETRWGNRDVLGHANYFYTDASYVVFIFLLGTYATLKEAENDLIFKRITLTYQLAEPIITPINVSGNLISYPSGTVYVEQVVADAGMYTTKMDILNTDLPIKTLDKLSKVDYTTGLEHQLDISKAVVSETSFTHPDLVENDIVFFEYYYDVESTNGNASIEYFDSRYTITDSVTDKIYKWTIAIADGVPSIEIEEV